jgi:hypothetical protein
VPHWLADFDKVAKTAKLYFKAADTSHVHRLYTVNSSATSASVFASVFTNGTGFDSGWGDLTTDFSGGGGATRLPASTGLLDDRGVRIFRRSTVPTVASTQWPNRPVVREFTPLTDPDGKLVQESGNYVAYYVAQNTSDPSYPGQTYRCTSTDLVNWTNHTLAMGVGSSGAYDDNGARVATVLKIGTGDYRMWYTATGSTAGPGVGYATSADGTSWTHVAQILNNSNCGITAITPYLSGVPDVKRLADGTYAMFCEARLTSGSGYPWHVFGWTSPNVTNGGTWTVMNSGSYVINGTTNGVSTYGIANPHLWERGVGDYLLFCEAFAGSGSDLTTFNGQAAFWKASSLSGPYTLVNEAVAGRINVNPSNFGTEAGGLAEMPDGSPVFFIQDYPAPDNLNTVANVHRVYPVADRLGVFRTSAAADGALASVVLASGNFTAENRGNLTTHRSGDNAIYVLGVADSAASLTVDTSTNNLAKFRAAIRHHTFSSNQQSVPSGIAPGSISFLYWDTGGAIHYYDAGGVAWTLVAPSFEDNVLAAGTFTDFSDLPVHYWSSSTGAAAIGRGSGYDGTDTKPGGSQCAFIVENGWISQSVSNVAAGTYTVTLWSKLAASYPTNLGNRILVKVDGVTVDTIIPTTQTWTSFTTAQFTVAAGTRVLRFEGTNEAVGAIACLDLVAVNPVSTAGWTTTTTAVAGVSDTLREVIYRIDDSGTFFVFSARYADDGTTINSAAIAKSSVKAFTNSRVAFAGVPFNNVNYGDAYSRRISVRPYASTEPSISAGILAKNQAPIHFLVASRSC